MAPKKNQVKRNERERKRVHQVNDGFDLLRGHLKHTPANKKLSKADTLREAAKYIQQLRDMLNSNSISDLSSTTGMPMFGIKDEFNAYFPMGRGGHHQFSQSHDFMSAHGPLSCPDGSMVNNSNQNSYTSPSSTCSTSYSPQQMYYSPQPATSGFHNGMHHSP